MDCRWRIGNEKLVGIWESNWLPRKQDPQVLSLICETLAEARVEILIDSELRQWNHGMMEGIFFQEEAELIKNLHLPTETYEDSLFWPFTHNGVYNSKFGYRFLKAEGAPNVESVLVASEKTMWKEVLVSTNPKQNEESVMESLLEFTAHKTEPCSTHDHR